MSARTIHAWVLLSGLLAACQGGGETTAASTAAATGGEMPGSASEVSGAASTAGPDGPTTGQATTTDGVTTNPGTTNPGTTNPGTTNPGTTTEADTSEATSATGPGTSDATTAGDPPPLDDTACQGYATRYWDCCKAHCGWQGNVNPATEPLQSCDKGDNSLGAAYDVASSCQAPAENSAFTCYSGAPWAVSDTLAYGFAAVPAMGDICGRCYQLDFDGTGHYNAQDPGSVALADKAMIVQATNIGHDVGGGQFDILTPGGGVGLFDACSYQWNVNTSELGATYGGFMTFCQQQGGDHEQIKQCVLGRCAAVFDEPGLAELAAGCEWYVQWYEAADNPNLHYQEVPCPPQLVAISGIDRGPLNDIAPCKGGGGSCSQEEMDNCDCGWTNGGQNCGQDDGSCCWTACCGR
ncbi:hypothetical protein [Nannocystis punicea]|uniref:Cellulase n=1 Tax=Nannocystis punicea TaxID=2995304 RepID=A0ABY7HCB6_9BACT|nr:hypothetical protein [Nannocystis poenicansa]WAS96913.1 hypothetical protein O0S08_12255 [Nannocystis poenicansa]